MLQKSPVNGFKWIKNLSKFDEDFIKDYNKNSNKGYVFEVDVEYPKDLLNLHSNLPFLDKRRKIEKYDQLVCNLHDKKLCCAHKNFKTSIKSRTNIKKK